MSQPKHVCIYCRLPIYYLYSIKNWAHECDRPSKVAAKVTLMKKHGWTDGSALPSTWARWIPCEDTDGTLAGTNATYWPEPNMEGSGI